MAHRERRKRVRSFLYALLARPLVFVAWSFVLWGTLVAALVVVKSLNVGPREALSALAGSGDSSLGWANALSAVIAVATWSAVVVVRLFARPRTGESADAEADD